MTAIAPLTGVVDGAGYGRPTPPTTPTAVHHARGHQPKSSSRIDLTELLGFAYAITALDAIVVRSEQDYTVGARGNLGPVILERLRKLDGQARSYRKDTGVNALVLGFPILVLKDQKGDGSSSVKIAPVLLWPIRIVIERGPTSAVKIGFDPDRDVEVNPAFDTILGPDAAKAWKAAADELLRGGSAAMRMLPKGFQNSRLQRAMSSAPSQWRKMPINRERRIFI